MDRSTFAIDVPDNVLQRAQRGELRAFEQIYRLFERPVYTLALRLLNDADAAREILHDAMLKLFQRLDQFRGDSPFWGWLRQIALNEALMRLRKDKRIEFDASYDDIETDLSAGWKEARGSSRLEWDRARHATRDAWQRVSDQVERALPGDRDRDGR